MVSFLWGILILLAIYLSVIGFNYWLLKVNKLKKGGK